MNDSLHGKIAIVTGGSSGLGKAIARKLAQEGAEVIITARNERRLLESKEEMRKQGLRVHAQKMDVGNEDDVKRVVDEVISQHKRIDILVNNAGVGFKGPVDTMETEKFDLMMNTNVRGVFLMTKYVLPHMKSQRSGYIINISSGAGKSGIPNLAVYCASKYAVAGFSEAVAQEARQFDVRVSVVYPGSINTDFHTNFGESLDDATKEIMMQPEDVAETIYHAIVQPLRYWIFDITMRAFLRGKK